MLVTAAARSLATSVDGLYGTIASLPALDMYFPFPTHRRTWKATADVRVATVFDADALSVLAFDTRGVGAALTRDMAESVPLLLLHPAESKRNRDRPQPSGPGDVIQDPSDGTTSTVYGGGQQAAVSAAGRTAASMLTGLYINHFNIQIGDGWFGHSEMRFYAVAVVLPIYDWVGAYDQFPIFEATCLLGTHFVDGVEEDDGYDQLRFFAPVTTLGPYSCNNQQAILGIQIVEDDGGLNGNDDEFGWRFFTGPLYPGAAAMNTVMSFYENTWGGTRSAYFRVVFN